MEPRASLLSGELLERICRQRIESSQTFSTRLRDSWREFCREIAFLFRERPVHAWTMTAALALTFLACWLLVIWAYNVYSSRRTNCELFRAQVGVEVRRREDLIPNLVVCVSRYTVHEKDVMRHVAEARQVLAGPADLGRKLAAAKEMQGTLARLLGIVEQYPNLRASEPVQSVIKELAVTENRIADAKGRYNQGAREFNNLLTSIPTNYLGWCFGYRRALPYISTEEDLLRAAVENFGKEP
jgi:LemA protein